MKSKKWNKLGTTLICSLPPLAALVVTGVVVATTKPAEPVIAFAITEPDTAEGRHADSTATSESWTHTTDEEIKYLFEFSGEFKLTSTSVTLNDLKATAKITYQPSVGGDPIVYDMDGVITVVSETDKTFKLALTKTFKYDSHSQSSGKMYEIVGNTDVTVSDIIFSNTVDENTYKCEQTYTAKIVPTLVVKPEGIEFEIIVTQYSKRLPEYNTAISFANPIPGTESRYSYNTGLVITMKEAGWKKLEGFGNDDGWGIRRECSSQIEIYTYFSEVPAEAGSSTEIGFECWDWDRGSGGKTTCYFKKEIGKGPAIKIKVPE